MITILAEKPSVAREIAAVVGARTSKKGYLEGNGYCVTWAFGHLVELEEPDGYDSSLKKWSIATLPFIPQKFKLRISRQRGVGEQFRIIKSLFQHADEIVCATDAGREGELIFRYILEKSGCRNTNIKRLWISSLTREAIRNGLNSLRPLSQFDSLAHAAKCRSEADWIIGMNATRAYTCKYSHGSGVFSVGRVQTPVLSMIVSREIEIRNFKPEPFWVLETTCRDVLFTHEKKRFTEFAESQKIYERVQGREVEITKVEEKEQKSPAPLLFDLTELQRTMNKICGSSATNTLKIAQKLYESKLITYPRTDSRYLSDDIFPTCPGIIKKLHGHFPEACSGIPEITKRKRFFNSAKVSDHHAIIPTGHFRSLDGLEKLLFELIVNRFLAIFYPDSISQKTTVEAQCNGEVFRTKGTRLVVPGWKALLMRGKEDNEEKLLPAFSVGETGQHKPEIRQSETKPPKYYTEATLLSAMEFAGKVVDDEELRDALKEKGLGTPATRASIIETLVKRSYIRKENKILRPEPKGEQLITLLQGQTTLTSPELTGAWEHQLNRMAKGEFEPSRFMEAVRGFARKIVSDVTDGNSALGLGACPQCGAAVIKGTKGGYGCSAWKEGCGFRFFGEQYGVKLTDDHVSALLAKGRLPRPRKLQTLRGEVAGYLQMNQYGEFSVLTKEEKLAGESLGRCPLCGNPVVETYKAYSCTSCDFSIWKKISGRSISPELASILLKRKKSRVLKGFRSKQGKRFSAVLVLKEGKIEFEF